MLPEIDRELLGIDDVLPRMPDLDDVEPTFWAGGGEHAWDPSTRTWRFYDWSDVPGCVSPESLFQGRAERRLASTHCIRGRTGSVYTVAEDGTALVIRVGDQRRVCPGVHVDSTSSQLVWTRLAIEPHATTTARDEPPSDPATTP